MTIFSVLVQKYNVLLAANMRDALCLSRKYCNLIFSLTRQLFTQQSFANEKLSILALELCFTILELIHSQTTFLPLSLRTRLFLLKGAIFKGDEFSPSFFWCSFLKWFVLRSFKLITPKFFSLLKRAASLSNVVSFFLSDQSILRFVALKLAAIYQQRIFFSAILHVLFHNGNMVSQWQLLSSVWVHRLLWLRCSEGFLKESKLRNIFLLKLPGSVYPSLQIIRQLL